VTGNRRRLIVVSNRGPVSYATEDGRRVARRGGGGLVTALAPLVALQDVTWIANAMTDEDRAVAAEAGAAFDETGRGGARYRLHLVDHEPATFGRFYNQLANPVLWFLQHEMPELVGRPADAAWDAYRRVNEAVAEAVLEELHAAPDTPVWFHDYHLYLAPAAVRAARPEAALSHFVHIPWARPDGWNVLPESWRRAIHEGLLANDVVGFHTDRWRENFLAAVAEIVGPDAELPLVTAHPISVDTREFEELAGSEAVLAEERDLESLRTERMVLRVDRTDPTKNIVRGFEAFALYLERHPEAQGRVGMVALLDPSRQDIPQYASYLDEIVATVAAVNDRLGREGWQPIHLEIQDNFSRSVAAYKQYDVLFVNAVADGLNLVAKEAPLVNERDGVVVLSRNAGACEELGGWSVVVDPFDVPGQADALHEALELPAADRRERAEAIRAHVQAHDLADWLRLQLADLDRVSAVA
jgi:trehalose 6-phosphate synthase